jgi:hypothetical protein
MPDMYPSGYADFLAEERAKEGFDKYCNGDYPEGKLWVPDENG